MLARGKFIVLEGIDGSGKTGQAKFLAGYLFTKAKHHHIFLTREPYDSPHLAEIRKILKESSDPKAHAERLAELFVLDRKVHTAVLERHLQEGTHVVCDRYKHSTLVFQSNQGVPLDKLIKMHIGVLVPDLTLIIDVPAKEAMTRITRDSGRTHREIFEQEEFLEKLRTGYLELNKRLPGEKITIVNGLGRTEEVFERVKLEVDKVFANIAK